MGKHWVMQMEMDWLTAKDWAIRKAIKKARLMVTGMHFQKRMVIKKVRHLEKLKDLHLPKEKEIKTATLTQKHSVKAKHLAREKDLPMVRVHLYRHRKLNPDQK
jgi:hypothetical protein